MLTEIRIESLGAISSAVGEFDRGLTVLTGETGTGKTMVVTGLHLLGGARADATRVRSGADRAVVEGRFSTTDLDEAMVVKLDEMLDASGAERDEDGSVIALRSVSRDGPSRAYLGGRSVPAKSLGDFTAGLLTLHGQNDQLRLIRPEEQCGALDRFAKAGPALERYCKLRDAWLSARRDLLDRRNRMRELALEADRLTFALNEIDAVDPQPGEDDALVAEIVRLSELDTLREAAATARAALSSDETDGSGLSATDSLGKARAALESTDDAKLVALAAQIGEVLTVLVDAAGELGGFLEELPVDASALESKLTRQGELRTLTRKYAADVDGVIRWAQEARQRLAQLDVSEAGLTALADRVDQLGRELAEAAVDLSNTRRKAAKRLAKEVTAELAGLAMADAQFTIDVIVDAVPDAAADDSAALRLASGELVRAGADGVDQVEFGFAAHRGMDQLPLAKSASGGELSRVMLALEVVLATSRKEAAGTTMVFDEVDAGVGGRAAVQIGRRLARLARTHQVIVVTHLPQVAAYADVHLVVHAAGPKGTSVVRRLGGDERVAELARMLAGLGESDSGRAHARELLEAAQKDEI
ncbi:DNA repair protein RecN [Mycobacterium sp. 852002-10029_SCH5224772]|uniref:DNA repair protein RecN n=1 Tax=Mycobacterium sp. 852002-10029_SCH5224772 TaxID=1834083 RepID=UPI0008012864|nr:DNA repair protein RecN [Mycobacterium sp. 852002-10029_SCH5224772]OBF10027.1 DNA repair protein RecN [Mycobacterium sp. 852002-10029_SCH5224772]